jgi:hypothetical protein
MTTGAADQQISRLGPEIPKTAKHPRKSGSPMGVSNAFSLEAHCCTLACTGS